MLAQSKSNKLLERKELDVDAVLKNKETDENERISPKFSILLRQPESYSQHNSLYAQPDFVEIDLG